MDVGASSWPIGAWIIVLHLPSYDNPSIDDDLDGSSVVSSLSVEDVASLVFFLLMLKSHDLGDNESGARILKTKDLIIFILVHSPVHGHLLKSFHLLITHGVVGAIVIEDHGALVCALEGVVASASACETFDGTCLDGLIGWSR